MKKAINILLLLIGLVAFAQTGPTQTINGKVIYSYRPAGSGNTSYLTVNPTTNQLEFQPAVSGIPLASQSVAGISKIYNSTGINTDGSITQQAITDALFLKAPLASPVFTGVPTAPTASPGTSTTQIASTAFVAGAISSASDNYVKLDPSPDTSQEITGQISLKNGGDQVLRVQPSFIAFKDLNTGFERRIQNQNPVSQDYNYSFPNSTGTFALESYVDDNVYNKTLWKSPQDYNPAAGDGVTDATAAIQQCFDENDNVFLYGNYKITSQIVPRSGQFVFSNNATIRNYDVDENTFAFPALSRFSFDGKLTIEGNGKAAGDAIAMFLVGCHGFSLKGITIKNMSGTAISLAGGGLVRGDRGAIIDMSLQNNWVGVSTSSGDEYHTFTNLNAGSNGLAVSIMSGNIIIQGGSISDNDAGIYIGAGPNHAHGILSGLNVNHNTAYNLKVENIDQGHTITGCHFYGTVTENIIIVNSKGLNFNGGIIDGLISNNDTNTPRGMHQFNGCAFRSFTSFTDNDMNNTNVIFRDCFNMVTGELSQLNNKTSKVINDMQSADIIGSGFFHTTVATPTNNVFEGTFPGGIFGSAARDKNTSYVWYLGTDIQGNWWTNRKFADVWQTPRKIIIANPDGTVSGTNGVNNNEFITFGQAGLTYSAKTSNYTLTATDGVIDFTSGSSTATLPTAVGISGKRYFIKNSGAGVTTIATTSSQTIDGSSGLVLFNQNSTAVLVSDGTNWKIIDSYGTASVLNSTMNTAQTAATLNSAYPSAPVPFVLYAPNVGSGMVYIKTTTGGQWMQYSGSLLNP